MQMSIEEQEIAQIKDRLRDHDEKFKQLYPIIESERKGVKLEYTFLFARNREELEFDPIVLRFSEGVTPFVPSVGDRIEYGSPVIVGNVRSREIRFMHAEPIKNICVVFMVDQDKTILTGGTPKRAGFQTEVKG
jgi:hypothetical protein